MCDICHTCYNVCLPCSACPCKIAYATLEQSEYKAGSTALRKQDHLLQDLVTAAQEPVWVDPTIPPDLTPKKSDGRDGKSPAGEGTELPANVAGEIQPDADVIDKIIASEDWVMQAEDGTKILVKAGTPWHLRPKTASPHTRSSSCFQASMTSWSQGFSQPYRRCKQNKRRHVGG